MNIQIHACYMLPSVSLRLLYPLIAIYLLYSQHLKNWLQTPIAPGLPYPLVFPCTKDISILVLHQSFKEDSSPAFFNCLQWIKDYIYKIYIFYMQLRTNNIYLSTVLLWGRKLRIPSTFNLGTKNSLNIIEHAAKVAPSAMVPSQVRPC